MPEQSPTRFTMVPARRSNEPTGRRRARRILGALFLAAALSVVAVFLAVGKKRPEVDLSGVAPQGRDLAHTAAVNYLAGKALSVPHAATFDPEKAADAATALPEGRRNAPMAYQSLGWVGFSPQRFGSEKAGITDFEVHHFLLVPDAASGAPESARARPEDGGRSPAPSADPRSRAASRASEPAGAPTTPAGAPTGSAAPDPSGEPTAPAEPTEPAAAGDSSPSSPSSSPSVSPDGSTDAGGAPVPASNVLQLDVSVLLTPRGPRLAAVPAFSVWTGGARTALGKADYTNYNKLIAEVSDAATNQIAQWAKAYAAGDSAALLALTGDQDGSHHYLGLAGFTLPDSGQAVQILSAIKVARGHLIVRVRVLLARTGSGGTARAGTDATGQFITYADFDLLVGSPAGARPPILAWGPAGSAAELEPYSNAITR